VLGFERSAEVTVVEVAFAVLDEAGRSGIAAVAEAVVALLLFRRRGAGAAAATSDCCQILLDCHWGK
jgi:hypothetical protein